MSNFLFVLPADWLQLDWNFVTTNIPSMTLLEVQSFIETYQFNYIELGLKAHFLIPETSTVINAVIFENEFFAVLLG